MYAKAQQICVGYYYTCALLISVRRRRNAPRNSFTHPLSIRKGAVRCWGSSVMGASIADYYDDGTGGGGGSAARGGYRPLMHLFPAEAPDGQRPLPWGSLDAQMRSFVHTRQYAEALQ